MAESGRYDAVIALGAVIRGATTHYELVSNETTKGVAQTSLATGIPIMFGIITTENIKHAFKKRKKHASITAGSLSGKYFFRSAKITINPKTHKVFCLF